MSPSQIATLSSASSKQPHNASPAPPRTLRHPNRKASGIGGIVTASTPNLSSLYSAHSKLAPPPSLQRKASQAALTLSSLATIPDDQTYALDSLNESPPRTNQMAPSPYMAAAGDDLSIGDSVDVPGNMSGTIRFIGTVQGKKGTFAGVELHSDFASRGKNNGDVDGVSYFSTSVSGAGIFLPLNKAVKREHSPISTTSSFPMTPTLATNGLKAGTQNSTNYTPPTPSLPQFSKSVGPGRATSPLGKKSRPSLARPESPVRKLQPPGARASPATPSAKGLPRFGSPTSKFSKSVHGATTPGDPGKKGMLKPNRNLSIGPRSASALSGHMVGFATDEESTPRGISARPNTARPASALKFRAPSRQNTNQDEEIERLRAELEARDRQLKEQATTLADLESSLTEVTTLMEQAEMPHPRKGSVDDRDAAQLRALVKDKNEKIAMLTAEFDAHRADFRSTIDTLELASSETERVYERRIEELMQDLQQIQDRTSDVDVVAQQLKQLEELVAELEEGLEDARRGEAEARGEVEFLRGEVERTRAELRREREKAAGATNGTNGATNGDQSAVFKELEQKEDEIRGLKAIIHSLSRGNVPGDVNGPYPQRSASVDTRAKEDDHVAREKLEREVSELRALLSSKTHREEEMENEMESLRRGRAATLRGSNASWAQKRASARDSRDTVVLTKELDSRLPGEQQPQQQQQQQRRAPSRSRRGTLDTMAESDALSSVTENSTLWCELCETSGHDILTCTNMFGSQGAAHKADPVTPPRPKKVAAPNGNENEHKLTPPADAPQPVDGDENGKMAPNPMDSGPVAGKESGVVDTEAWCAICEKDGHTSVDCPFEDAF